METTGKTAFTGQNPEHVHEGPPVAVRYPTTTLACDCWDGIEFRAPRAGLYHFSVSFVRDQQQTNDENCPRGTSDDTRIDTLVDGKTVAAAWAGESSGRQTGVVAVTLQLGEGAVVSTRDWTDQDRCRRLRNCVITGFSL